MRVDGDAARDLRREPRLKAEGVVELSRPGRYCEAIEAQLMDISASGFRASHGCAELESGSVIQFRHHSGQGHARVVWNRIMGGAVESGFSVVES